MELGDTMRHHAARHWPKLGDAMRLGAWPFKGFLKIATCRKASDVPEGFGDRITADGKPAFYVERNRAYVRAAEDGSDVIGNYHPSEVLPEMYRPEAYRSTPAMTSNTQGDR